MNPMKTTCVALALCLLAVAAGSQAAARTVSDICPNFNEVMQRSAIAADASRRGIGSGEVTITLTLTADNQVTDIAAVGASHPILENWAIGVVKQLQCNSGGQEQHLSIPFAYRLDFGSSYTPTRDDIPVDRLGDVVPRIAQLKATPETFSLKVGEGVNVEALKVLAYDQEGKLLGRLRQFDRDAQPKTVLTMRGAGIAQASAPGVGFLELSVPSSQWKRSGSGHQRPTVRVQISVSE